MHGATRDTGRAEAYRLGLVAVLPAFALAVGYEVFLGHRHDYLGHYAAGYGGTWCALMVVLGAVPGQFFARVAIWLIAPATIVCIAAGGVAEATVFRLAKFDEVDFCNQSLGAVLAGLAAVALVSQIKPRDATLWLGVLVGVAFLSAGGYFALL